MVLPRPGSGGEDKGRDGGGDDVAHGGTLADRAGTAGEEIVKLGRLRGRPDEDLVDVDVRRL